MGSDWPDRKLFANFLDKAEGLFIWAATVCDYLRLQVYPSKHLVALSLEPGPLCLPAEAKMDKLYSTILSACNWEDGDFAEGYKLLVGGIMAARYLCRHLLFEPYIKMH